MSDGFASAGYEFESAGPGSQPSRGVMGGSDQRFDQEFDLLTKRFRHSIVTSQGDVDWHGLAKALESFEIVLKARFRQEELGGHLSEVLDVAAERDREVEKLRVEHVILLGDLRRLIDFCQGEVRHKANHGAFEQREKCRSQFEQWAHRLNEHEEAENKLIQEVFIVDIGCGD